MSDEELTQLLAVGLLLQLVERLQDVALHVNAGRLAGEDRLG
jgi:phytoene/squalene synthetase